MNFDFDRRIDRRETDSIKWNYFGPDVLPMWVADMDFLSPPAVITALQKRATEGFYGYPRENLELSEMIVERLRRLYDWEISPEAIVYLPGVVAAFNLACQAVAEPGDGVLVQTPVYPPMLAAAENGGLVRDEMELTRTPGGRYEIDFDRFAAALTERTKAFLLCNPHNPVGRVYRPDELQRMAEICLGNKVILISDEIHCDLVFSGHTHTPVAALSPEIADQTITLMAPSKTYNIAGLEFSFAVISNRDLRKRFIKARRGLLHFVNVFGLAGAMAAYEDTSGWLEELLVYLEGNRDFLMRFVHERLPGISMGVPEGTYLAWLDCRGLGLAGDPCDFFLKEARVAMNDGCTFGKGGEGFMRLNFGCPRSVLVEALERISAALKKREPGLEKNSI